VVVLVRQAQQTTAQTVLILCSAQLLLQVAVVVVRQTVLTQVVQV
jgi:hypothetical protein